MQDFGNARQGQQFFANVGRIAEALEKPAPTAQNLPEEFMREVWQAFSTLSDAQELIGMGEGEGANEQVNHAKRHLMVVLDAARAVNEQAFLSIMTTLECTLGDPLEHEGADDGI